jgi:hypothetical protein
VNENDLPDFICVNDRHICFNDRLHICPDKTQQDIVSSQVSQIKPNTTLFASTYMTGHSKDASTSYVCRIKGQTGTMFVVATNIVQACFTSQNELPKINFSK